MENHKKELRRAISILNNINGLLDKATENHVIANNKTKK